MQKSMLTVLSATAFLFAAPHLVAAAPVANGALKGAAESTSATTTVQYGGYGYRPAYRPHYRPHYRPAYRPHYRPYYRGY
ncbi:MAG TPA: hypothetical protein VGD13_13575 [Xanthobacteraceae bacterium]